MTISKLTTSPADVTRHVGVTIFQLYAMYSDVIGLVLNMTLFFSPAACRCNNGNNNVTKTHEYRRRKDLESKFRGHNAEHHAGNGVK